MSRLLALVLGVALAVGSARSCIPRDPHPERTPSPAPTVEPSLQVGRQPAPTDR